MQKKIMWGLISLLSVISSVYLGFFWGSIAVIPITVLSWWVAYKSGWFDGMD